MNSIVDQQQINIARERVNSAVYRVANVLGTRFSADIYRNALAHELKKMGSDVKVNHNLNIYYDGVVVGTQPVDLLVDEAVMVVVRDGQTANQDSTSTIRHFLLASGQRLGMIIGFNKAKPSIEQVSYKL